MKNRLTLAQILDMTVEQVSKAPLDQIELLPEEVAGLRERVVRVLKTNPLAVRQKIARIGDFKTGGLVGFSVKSIMNLTYLDPAWPDLAGEQRVGRSGPIDVRATGFAIAKKMTANRVSAGI